jgi:SOS-response transcriptional repressor LexA
VSEELTSKQQEVWDYLINCIQQNGFQPSMQEMANHFQVDKNAIYMRIKGLIKKGWIKQNDPKRDRALTLKHAKFKYIKEISSLV